MPRLCGVVIAGGLSSRFGSEKALAVFRGEPLLLPAVRHLAQAGAATIAVNARPVSGAQALARSHGLEVLHDAVGVASGPLAGVSVALAWARACAAESVLVIPCDLPLLTAVHLRRLVGAAAGGPAMAVTPSGPQPLCAVWPVACEAGLAAALAGGQHPSVWRLLDQLGAVRVAFDDDGTFANANTAAELARLEGLDLQIAGAVAYQP